jgi:hypothetical protein
MGNSMTKPAPQHSDLFGTPLAVGDCVVFPQSNSMLVATVIKLNPKMVNVRPVGWTRLHYNKYPKDLVRVEGSEVTMYLLKKSATK